MLVLSRKNDEELVFHSADKVIRVRVFGVKASAVKLGIDAPREIKVLRGEIYGKEDTRDGA